MSAKRKSASSLYHCGKDVPHKLLYRLKCMPSTTGCESWNSSRYSMLSAGETRKASGDSICRKVAAKTD